MPAAPCPAAPVVVAVLGSVDAECADALRDRLHAVADTNPGDVVVDLSGVRTLAAAGVAVLVDLARALADEGRRARFVTGDGTVARVLRNAEVRDVVDVHPSLAAAVAADGAGATHPAGGVTADPPQLHQAHVELADLSVAADELRHVLTRLVELACTAVPGADGASVAIGPPTDPELVASSSAWAQSADGAQLSAESGPTVDAYRRATQVTSADVSTDPRWPHLHHVLPRVGLDVRGCLAVPLRTRTGGSAPLGVLTLYGHGPGALSAPAAAQQAERLAARATGLETVARRVSELVETRSQLRSALTSRATIDQAKGILMREHACSADEAFQLLRRRSNTTNQKVRDVAHAVIQEATGRTCGG